MSEVTIRPYEDRDEEGFYAVSSLTYNNGLEVQPERRANGFGGRFVAELDGQIAGIFSTLDMKATRGESLYNCAGVAGVAVAPHVRRGGVGVQMMRWSIRHFKDASQPLAALYAFREPFYAKSGYAVCGKRLRITVPAHRLPKVKSDLPVRRLGPADWAQLHECHTKFAHARSGINVRTEGLWGRVLNESKPLAIYAAGEPVEGYVAVSHQVAFWEEQWLSEVVWSTKEGYEACLAIMHQLGINKTSIAWHEPSDSPFYAHYLDQGVTAEVTRPAMFRVCDVQAALQGLQPQDSGSFTIKIRDDQVEENEGPFHVLFAGGQVQVAKAVPSPSTPDLEMEIGTFTQAFLGEPSLSELAQFGSVKVNSDHALQCAIRLLPHLPVVCSDFF